MEVDMNFGDVNEKLACHISKVRMLWPSNQQPLACLMVSPEGTQDGGRMGPIQLSAAAVPPVGHPKETEAENHRICGPRQLRYTSQ